MTKSILHMLKETLGSDFTAHDKDVWETVFAALIEDIVHAQNLLAFEEAVKKKKDVIRTWKVFNRIKNYEEVGGVILFQQ
jgi:hypothetical protein